MRRPRPSALTTFLPLLAAALLTDGSAAANLVAASSAATRARGETSARAAQPKDVPIKDARALPPGSEVTIKGVVTTPPGAFKSSTEDEGFAIEDASGAGIYVRAKVRVSVSVGRRVRVTGLLGDSNGKLVINPVAGARGIEQLGRGGVALRPLQVSTREIGEATEGRLVRVTGVVSKPAQDDAPYGFRFFVDDGTGEVQIFVSASTKIRTTGLRPGRSVRVTGFSGQYKETYEVEPRFASDINFDPPPAKRRQRADGGDCGGASVVSSHGSEDRLAQLLVAETLGRAVCRVRPKFPRSCACQGTVVARVLVSPEGKVECVGTLNGHPLLQASAAEAARRWTFDPLTKGGRRGAFLGALAFNFHSHGKVTF